MKRLIYDLNSKKMVAGVFVCNTFDGPVVTDSEII